MWKSSHIEGSKNGLNDPTKCFDIIGCGQVIFGGESPYYKIIPSYGALKMNIALLHFTGFASEGIWSFPESTLLNGFIVRQKYPLVIEHDDGKSLMNGGFTRKITDKMVHFPASRVWLPECRPIRTCLDGTASRAFSEQSLSPKSAETISQYAAATGIVVSYTLWEWLT